MKDTGSDNCATHSMSSENQQSITATMAEPNHLYQYSLINALMAGVADSGISVSEFIKKGSQGIGTFTKIEGELVLLDGKVYQLQANGGIRIAQDDEQLPYAVATEFVADVTLDIELATKDGVDRLLQDFDDHAKNLFLSYRIDGAFRTVKARTVKGQEYEGQSLAELGPKQEVHTFDNVKGTVVGFRAPATWQGFMVAGEHMHFIDEERKAGGHVLELKSEGTVKIGVAVINNVHIELPKSRSFNAANMKTDDSGVKGVEG